LKTQQFWSLQVIQGWALRERCPGKRPLALDKSAQVPGVSVTTKKVETLKPSKHFQPFFPAK
jgi:hypothetical protein